MIWGFRDHDVRTGHHLRVVLRQRIRQRWLSSAMRSAHVGGDGIRCDEPRHDTLDQRLALAGAHEPSVLP
jgi:hypothetical protein